MGRENFRPLYGKREEFGYLLICSGSTGLESQQNLGIQRSEHMSYLNWQDDVSHLSWTSVIEASSRLIDPSCWSKGLLLLLLLLLVKLVWPCAKNGRRKAPSKNFGMVPTWKTKIGKTSKFVDAEVTIRMRERGIRDLEWVNREGRGKKINLL